DGGVATAPVHHADLHSASRSSETDHLPTIAVIAAHRADRSSVCAVRERGSSLDAPPDTPHPTLPLISETTASNPSLRCPLALDLAAQRRICAVLRPRGAGRIPLLHPFPFPASPTSAVGHVNRNL